MFSIRLRILNKIYLVACLSSNVYTLVNLAIMTSYISDYNAKIFAPHQCSKVCARIRYKSSFCTYIIYIDRRWICLKKKLSYKSNAHTDKVMLDVSRRRFGLGWGSTEHQPRSLMIQLRHGYLIPMVVICLPRNGVSYLLV